MQTNKFQNKTIFITGAARGIGAETAKRMHVLGANIVLVGLEAEVMQSIATELGERAISIEVDVCDREALKQAADTAAETFGGIDYVLANAGINFICAIHDSPPEMIERTFDVNLYGVWNTIYATLPYVIERKGYIANISSMAALLNGGFFGAYSASKTAVEAFSNSLRQEMKLYDVGVGCIYFGAIDTDLVRGGKKLPIVDILSSISPAKSDPIPLSKAVDSIIKGIEKYSDQVFLPKGLSWVYRLRGFLQPMMEKRIAKDPRMIEALQLSRRDAGEINTQDLKMGSSVLAQK